MTTLLPPTVPLPPSVPMPPTVPLPPTVPPSLPELVAAACEAIAARRETPTVDRVRAELKGGSPNRLTPLVRDWKAAQRDQPTVAVQPNAVDATDPAALPAAIQQPLMAVTAALAALAPAVAEVLAGAAEAERRRTHYQIDQIEIRALERIEAAQAAAEEEEANTDLVRRECTEREADVARLTSELESLTGQVTSLTIELEQARQQVAEAKMDAHRQAETITGLEATAEGASIELAHAIADTGSARAVADAAQADTERARAETADLRTKLDLETADLRVKLEAAREAIALLRTDVAVAQRGEEAERHRAERAESDLDRMRADRAEVGPTA